VVDLERTRKERRNAVGCPNLGSNGAGVTDNLVSDVHLDNAHARYIHRPCHAAHRCR
jgi:hypothetical protein